MAKRGVKAAENIVIYEQRFDVVAQVLEINIVVSIDLFASERLHNALRTRVVVWIRWPAHAGNHLVFSQYLHVLSRGVLQATIGMMDQAWRRFARSDCSLQRTLG